MLKITPLKLNLLTLENSEFETLEVDNRTSEFTCDECGNLNNINSAFCSSCGQIFIPASEISGSDRFTMKPKMGIYAGFAFIAVSLVLLGFLF